MSLFDLSFSSFLAPVLVKVLYGISIVVVGLGSLLILLEGPDNVILRLFMAVLFFLVNVCWTRVLLEVVLVLFLIAERTEEIAASLRQSNSPRVPTRDVVTPAAARRPLKADRLDESRIANPAAFVAVGSVHCPKCGALFDTASELKEHTRLSHQ